MSNETNFPIPPQPVVELHKLPPFPRFCCSIGMIPSSYKVAMSYEEQLMWLCKYMEETVIPTINENTDATNSVILKYNEIVDFLNHYFDNLDVQQEINNKLDEMAENGYFEDILRAYVDNSFIQYFDTIDDLKNANLSAGQIAGTKGYYSINDGGQGIYNIIENENLTENGGTIISLENGLKACLHYSDSINLKQFGAKGDGIADDTLYAQNCLDFCGINHLKCIINGLFLVNNLKLNSYINGYVYSIHGFTNKQTGASNISLKNGFVTNSSVFTTDENSNVNIQLNFENISANVKNKSSDYSSFIEKCLLFRSRIANCNIDGFDYVINGSMNGNTIIENNNFKNVVKACFKVYDSTSNGFYDSTIQNNYINAFHDANLGFHGKPSLRTSVLLDNYRVGFGYDGRFINNFVDYFTYFIDKGISYDDLNNLPTPTYSTREGGLVSNNVFQNMLNMIGIGIELRGVYTNNVFDNFAKSSIFNAPDSNMGAFSIATCTIELNDNGDFTETLPYRKFDIITIADNIFDSCTKAVYFDFDYDSFEDIGNKLTSTGTIIEGNRTTSPSSRRNF